LYLFTENSCYGAIPETFDCLAVDLNVDPFSDNSSESIAHDMPVRGLPPLRPSHPTRIWFKRAAQVVKSGLSLSALRLNAPEALADAH
jgi:hypothetical protein